MTAHTERYVVIAAPLLAPARLGRGTRASRGLPARPRARGPAHARRAGGAHRPSLCGRDGRRPRAPDRRSAAPQCPRTATPAAGAPSERTHARAHRGRLRAAALRRAAARGGGGCDRAARRGLRRERRARPVRARRAHHRARLAPASVPAAHALLLRGKSRSRPLCGLLKRDGVTEAFELGDEALGGAGGVAAAVVVAAEVVVELAGGEHVPGGDEQRVLDRADRFAVPDPGALALIERA